MANILVVGAARPGRELTEGHEVFAVDRTAEAVRLLEGLIFDLVVVPVGLPLQERIAVSDSLHADSVHSRTLLLALAPDEAREPWGMAVDHCPYAVQAAAGAPRCAA